MADHPLRPARDRRLGRPLPHQLANLTQAHPIAQGPKIPCFPPWGVCGINPSFLGLSPSTGQIPTRYSPVRRSTPGSKLPSFPLDLHVLSLPPAFNLSHDQTLQFNLRSGHVPTAARTTSSDKENNHYDSAQRLRNYCCYISSYRHENL